MWHVPVATELGNGADELESSRDGGWCVAGHSGRTKSFRTIEPTAAEVRRMTSASDLADRFKSQLGRNGRTVHNKDIRQRPYRA
jgi:hypothetical protein